MDYSTMSREALQSSLANARKRHNLLVKEKLNLDLSRGKPSPEQLDLSMPLLNICNSTFKSPKGADYRNYGYLDGVPELREVLADILSVNKENVMVGGSNSLNLMYDVLSRAYCFGVCGSTPWCKLSEVKFICPVPGYDRHFTLLEQFGIQMISVPLDENGPDMDLVEELVAGDQNIKGMFCVPRFSNPTGIVYSDEVVTRLMNMRTAATDFRIFWDNAYFAHDLYPDAPKLKNVFCEENPNIDRFYMFVSTSKITFASGGISALVCSDKNFVSMHKMLSAQTINYDKINQYAHAQFLQSAENLRVHMEKHAAILRPKFEVIIAALRETFDGCKAVKWTEPKGGYFITITTLPKVAHRVIELCRKAGLKLTEAGCAHPLHRDDMDSTIRVAPSYAPMEELDLCAKVLVTSLEYATLEELCKK
ncbi:MAG: aminotransferase class I/II-fold pyridoxal phosphate-dependent enzyme [Clostridia bacterium]|nr:aminotransferase class I/II-fold pyridoxal phosphate-dependent enzyme [Clostridia bacterium]